MFQAMQIVLRGADRADEILEADMPPKLLEVLEDGAEAQLALSRRRGGFVNEEPIEQELPDELLPVDPFNVGEDGEGALDLEAPTVAQSVVDFGFDATNPLATRWAAEHGSSLVVQVTAETRRAIRKIMAEAFEQGLPPLVAARRIRPLVGLLDRHAAAVVNLEARLRDPANYGKTVTAFGGKMKWKVPARGFRGARGAQLIRSRVNRYADRLHRWRANNIARTETLFAANEGQRQLWVQAQQAGEMPVNAKRVWIITPDTRLCPICQPMRGQIKSMSELFVTGNGNLVVGPPAHPSCRCAVGLVRGTGQGTTPTGQPVPRRPTTRPPGPRGRPTTPPRPVTEPPPPVVEPPPPPPPAPAATPAGGVEIPPLDRRYTWKEFGAKTPRIKERAKLLEDALNQALGSMPANLRAQYIKMLEDMPAFNWRVATKSTKSVRVLGQLNSNIARSGKPGAAGLQTVGAPRPTKLTLHLSRYNEAYDDYSTEFRAAFKKLRDEFARTGDNDAFQAGAKAWKLANPEPEFFRLAKSQEVAETLVHELAHAIDVTAGTSRLNWYGITKQWQIDDMQNVWWQDGYWSGNAELVKSGNRSFVKPKPGAKGNEIFQYGTTKPTEGFAEVMRLYFTGSTKIKGQSITAAEFRAQYPRLAEWVERVVIGGG